MLRRVASEPATALLVQRALVMEVAHPKVAAGVDQHSGFRGHPWPRALATFDAALRLVFGDTPVALGALRQIYGTHDHIHGEAPNGEAYTAHDASLLTWVWATLVDSAEVAYTRWVAPMDREDRLRYYDEALAFGAFFGIDPQLMPPDHQSFRRYMDEAVESGVLGSSELSKRLAAEVLWYRHWSVAPPLVRIQRSLAATTLPPSLLERLDLQVDDSDLRLGKRLDALIGRWYPRLPRTRRALPYVYLWLRGPTLPR
jgi:uncharacterized protein (DUF2236 family)